MRRLTMAEVTEHHGGKLPPDATLRAAVEPEPSKPKVNPGCRRARGERFAMLNAFADIALANLTGAETKVWLILFRDTKADTGTARTGQADIARRAGLSVRGVQKALCRLEGRGLVQVIRRGRLNSGPTIYRIAA